MDVFIERDGEGLTSPKGISFGPNGDLFVSNDEDNSVLRFSSNGSPKGVFVDENLSKEFDETNPLVNSTNQNDLFNGTRTLNGVDIVPSHGLIDPEGVAFFPHCENDVSPESICILS